MDILNKMTWMEEIIGKYGIRNLYEKANLALTKQAKEIMSNIKNIFYKDL